MKAAAVILAAGASTRTVKPKALIENSTGTMMQETVDPYMKQGIFPLVVTGFHATRIEDLARRLGLTVARNPDPRRGMASSIRTGIEQLTSETEILFIHPVDCPGVREATLKTLVSSLLAFPWAEAAKPTYHGRGGHPLLLRRSAWSRLLASRRMNARQLLSRLHGRVLRIEIDDPAVVRDIDEPGDIKTWRNNG